MTDQETVTAESFIIDNLNAAQGQWDRMNDLTAEPDPTKMLGAAMSLGYHFNTAALLEELRRHDAQRADELAQWLKDIEEAGESWGELVGELVGDWRDQIKRGHPMTCLGPDSAQPAPPAEAVPTTVLVGKPGQEQSMQVLGLPTSSPYLAITQHVSLGHNGYEIDAGRWTVTHLPSARVVLWFARPLDQIREIAEQIAACGLDWSLPTGAEIKQTEAWPKFVELMAEVRDHDCSACTDADHLLAPVRQPVSTH